MEMYLLPCKKNTAVLLKNYIETDDIRKVILIQSTKLKSQPYKLFQKNFLFLYRTIMYSDCNINRILFVSIKNNLFDKLTCS